MEQFDDLMDILRSIPFYLQLLVGVTIAGVIAMTALGAIIAWQLSAVAKAVRESAQHRIGAAQPPQQPPQQPLQPPPPPFPGRY